MGRGIVKIKDMYVEWSTIVDAPVTWGMTEDELSEYIQAEYGRQGLLELPRRLERVIDHGTSFQGEDKTPGVVTSCNRAGPNESRLTFNELYNAWCLRKPVRDGWVLSEEGWRNNESKCFS